MKISLSIVLALAASQANAFTTPMRSSTLKTGVSPSSLGFVPKDLSTTESISDIKMNAATLMPDSLAKKEDKSVWEQFANWVTSTENRLYIGWFGTLMFPTLLAATACFITAFIAAPPGKFFCEVGSRTRAPLTKTSFRGSHPSIYFSMPPTI